MIRKTIYFSLIFSVFAFNAAAQKVKYKDLFILLNAKQFDQAEPFLKKYLKENDDNPNAYLFMGSIYQDNASKKDILLQTDLMIRNIDSAIFFYDKAYKGLTEKEISRNDEYYEAYSRRDLRTGKFEIKLSDVKFDLEKRMQGLNERKEKIKTLVTQYKNAESAYGKVSKAFIDIQSSFPGLKEFYLRSDKKLMADLKDIEVKYDTFLIAFSDYKGTAKLMGKTGYNQVLVPTDIQDFKKDGTSTSDFTKDDLKIWDYKRWSMFNLDVIEKEVMPSLDNLLLYDIEINKLREKLTKDTVSVTPELAQMVGKIQSSNLKKYDPDPMPLALFGLKISELEYSSSLITNKPLQDSANVNLRLNCLKAELIAIHKMDSLAANLMQRNIEIEAENYGHFVTDAYGNIAVLKSLLKSTKDFSEREKFKKENEWEVTMQSLKWIVDAKDSIPLFADALKLNYKFKPLVIVGEDYTAGLVFNDSTATGYFYTISATHLRDIKVNFPIDKISFKLRNLPITKGISTTDGKGQVYFVLIYGESKVDGKFPATLAKIYRSDGMAWSKNITLEMLPIELLYKSDTAELSIKISDPSGDSKVMVIDKSGKVVQ